MKWLKWLLKELNELEERFAAGVTGVVNEAAGVGEVR